ncbi:hypothetical protein PENOC_075280 [Penicillium occitanis (nom. inval.)]|nr:hypothetical protein PENOC_075280 [Penicillium occitanis (nom. inval.)]
MPVGGGDVGLNVWAENGDILFYIAKSGAFDENNSLLKLGRVRLSMTPNPFEIKSSSFEQHLYINDGYITLSGDRNTLVKLWVDMDTSGIHTEVTSDENLNLTASFEQWRLTERRLGSTEQQQTSWGVNSVSAIPPPTQYPDSIDYHYNGVLCYHHNNDTPLTTFQVSEQGLSDADPNSFFNPMKNNTFGAFMWSRQLHPGAVTTGTYSSTNFTAYNLVSNKLANSFNIYIGTAQSPSTNVGQWVHSLIEAASDLEAASQESTMSWWHTFWDRSYIIINPDAGTEDSGFQVGKNYQYFRYMMACNAKGKYPTRFNGGLFTFDPYYVSSDYPYTPDYRKWSGGTFTAQNQRLLYWPLLKTGDHDIMQQAFNFYQDILPNSRALGKLYFGLDVALSSEQIDNTGLPNVYEYDANVFSYNETRDPVLYPAGIDFNDYLSWYQDTANEFVDMILQAKLYNELDISPWVAFVEYQLAWFDEFYQKRNGLESNGTLIVYPGSGAETYKLAFNSASTVSGLRKTLSDLLSLDQAWSKGNRSYYFQYLSRVPATPLHPCPGHATLTCVAPALNYSFTQNSEPTALYTVFPWGEYGLGQKTNLSYAINAYFNDTQSAGYHGTYGWRQDQIWFARMGLTENATTNTISRLTDSTTYRFSAFKGPNYDWSPDINHYGSGAIGLQEMLMQTFALNNTQIRLLPAWPSEWTGYFKLQAPFSTNVTANITGTSVSNLVVLPASRMSDVVYGTD